MAKRLTGLAASVLLGLTSITVLTASSGVAMAATPGPIAAAAASAIGDPTRPQADRDRDASRDPAAMLAFAGIKPGVHAIDVWTGSGYWARLFGKAVGVKGQVVAYVPAEVTGFKSKPLDVAKAMAAEPGRSNITVLSDPIATMPPKEDQNAFDVVWIFENYHDLYNSFMHGADVAAFNRAIYALLKPGGVFVVVDHAAAPGSALTHTEDLHRIDPASVRAALEQAGFVYDGKSDALANSADPHTAAVFDATIKGKTDRFAYRFRKPK